MNRIIAVIITGTFVVAVASVGPWAQAHGGHSIDRGEAGTGTADAAPGPDRCLVRRSGQVERLRVRLKFRQTTPSGPLAPDRRERRRHDRRVDVWDGRSS